MKPHPATLHELRNTAGYDAFISDRLSNQLFIDDPDRAERIHDAAKNGADGSTHYEHLQDMRDYLTQAHQEETSHIWRAWSKDELTDEQEDAATAAADAARDKILAEIDAAEAYHEKAGTLHQEIG